ncbi:MULTISPECIES: hypothetical protein [Sulfurimonas]|uniref:hypothetical protein n=1 Tax=Sulfurimonas TaxID=202746 RepID=UPI0012647A78|nr:hypothetical protein [Sulfurimonas indica]
MKVWLTLIIAALFVFNLFLEIDKEAMQILDASFERAMVAFGLAKALNAVISLIQGTELSLTPVGIGFNFSVGEVLDPFNDMVERFSWVMLFSSISLGVQKLLLTLSGKVFLQFALGVSALVSIGILWMKQLQNRLFFSISLKFFALLIILRFSAIIFVYSSQLMYDALLDEQYQEATQVITTTKEELEDIQTRNKAILQTEKESGFFHSLDNKYNNIVDSLNISKQLDALQQSIDDATHNIITLITVFVFQTLLFPLFYLWILLWLIRWIFAYENDKLKLLYNN